jgi:nucleoside-diphosphate-sugar epimerase
MLILGEKIMVTKKEITVKGSSVLITGGAGFIGSALVRKLETLDCQVTVLDNLVAGRPEHLNDCKARLVEGDIRNKELLKEILKRDNPELCFHLAAEPFIPKGYQNPEVMFDVNTLGTITILKACQQAKVKRILYYSTSEVYGTARTLPMGESHPTTPHSMYALAKFAGDRACFILNKERGIPVVILRQFNCFGPREAQPYIIPEIIRQFQIGPELLLGNVDAKRDFLWVYDHCEAVVKLMETPNLEGTVVNCGRGKNWSVREIADKLSKIMNRPDYTITQEKKRLRPYDVDELLCDNTLFNSLTGGIEYTEFEDGLKWLVEWYHRHGDKWSWERAKEMIAEVTTKKVKDLETK